MSIFLLIFVIFPWEMIIFNDWLIDFEKEWAATCWRNWRTGIPRSWCRLTVSSLIRYRQKHVYLIRWLLISPCAPTKFKGRRPGNPGSLPLYQLNFTLIQNHASMCYVINVIKLIRLIFWIMEKIRSEGLAPSS